MTDPDTNTPKQTVESIAQTITEKILTHESMDTDERLVNRDAIALIASAIREYGNEEYARGIGSKCDKHLRAWVCSGCGLEREKQADADGYARGLIERHKPGDPLCEKCDEAGYRRGVEKSAIVAEKCFDNEQPGFRLIGKGVADKIRQRGQEASELEHSYCNDPKCPGC